METELLFRNVNDAAKLFYHWYQIHRVINVYTSLTHSPLMISHMGAVHVV